MTKIKFSVLETFFFKSILRDYFKFLIKDFGFAETTDPKLVIKAWKIWGVAYTNGKIVIVCTDDILEKQFTVIRYDIQPDFKIPIHNDELYFTLRDFVRNKEGIPNSKVIAYWNTSEERKACIEQSILYIKKFSDEFLSPIR